MGCGYEMDLDTNMPTIQNAAWYIFIL